eukprot:TRINITY_DN520_c0_g1_i19.p1 TRINITY_DN520_c0_g1~~TRINITY_DN520_c0_g1_i19.p1  ORF type:complete len:243 (+),score=38.21 TRINITY_DN520_c0_g1_i19:137-865(+)
MQLLKRKKAKLMITRLISAIYIHNSICHLKTERSQSFQSNFGYSPKDINFQESSSQMNLKRLRPLHCDSLQQQKKQQTNESVDQQKIRLLEKPTETIESQESNSEFLDQENLQERLQKRSDTIKKHTEKINHYLKFKQPKVIKLGGSKIKLVLSEVQNIRQNLSNMRSAQNKQSQMLSTENKSRKISQQKIDTDSLEVLYGPPKYILFQTSTVQNDYMDIKTKNILENSEKQEQIYPISQVQ